MLAFWASEVSTTNFLSLPRDLIINEFIQWLHPDDLCHLSETCKGLSYISNDNAVWLKILAETNLSNWKDLLSEDEINLLEQKFGPAASPSNGFYTNVYQWATNLRSGVQSCDGSYWRDTPSHFVKLVITGDARCGKKSLSNTIRDGRYSPSEYDRCPVGMMSSSWTVADPTMFPQPHAPFGVIRAQLWEPLFQDRFRRVTRSFYREANTVILAFAIDSRASFDGLRSHWVVEALKHTPPTRRFVLVGLKCDVPQATREVAKHEARLLAAELGCPYIECSAKSGHNVLKLMEYAVTIGLKAELVRKRTYVPPAPPSAVAESIRGLARWMISWLPLPSTQLK
eukprot:TRINITY_DN10082_c0_g1_i1.p1 TRINITY_DN10082_c0_g1~~TRINITY_DN10082_c0_g1_i1.p1  ORF type:complete len:341 (+),score=23.76 TRINITY_DN10082_c0_g1_i1:142-1164(+)